MMTRRLTQAGIAAAIGSLFALPVTAQQADENRAQRPLEEITVTARKREENLREVPVAVTAITAQTLQRASISDVQDLALISPGLSYREAFGRSTGDASNRPSIRGMSSILGNPNAAFFVDGVFVDGPINAYSMENLERVEVIRGPQAATFGRGTFAGAVNFITRRPDDEFRGRIEVEASDHDMNELSAFVSGPLIEGVLAAELNGRYYDRGEDPGYTNLAPGGDPIGAEETKAVGVKFSWTPSEATSIYVNVNWSEDSDGTFAYGNFNGGINGDINEVNANAPESVNCFAPNQIGEVDFGFFSIPKMETLTRGYYCGEITTPGAFYDDTGGLNGVERETLNVNVIADFDIGAYTLTSVTGFTEYDFQNAFPAIYAGAQVAWGISNNNQTFSQELRLASPQDRRVRWLLGAYLYDQEQGENLDATFDPLTTNYQDVVMTQTFDDSTIENRAVFGSIEFDIGDDVTLAAEIRHQTEEHVLSGRDENGMQRFEGAPSIDFDATLPRVSLTWRATDDYNVYASIAEGNNPGDFNADYYSTAFDADERAFFVDERGFYDESEVRTYEAGIKGLFFDGRLSVNAAIYQSDWEKQALTQSDALTQAGSTTQSTIPYIINAGESEIRGVEIELLAAPTDWWDLGFSYALADSEFQNYLDENWTDLQDTNGFVTGRDFFGNQLVDNVDPDGQVAGNELPQTPRHMATANSTFRWPLNDGAEGFFRFDYSYESKRFVQAANLAWIGASHRLNARAGIEKGNWTFSVWAKNLTDDDTPEGVTRLLDFREFFYIPSQIRPPLPFPPFNAFTSGLRFTFERDFTVTAPRTREYGVTFSYNFGAQ